MKKKTVPQNPSNYTRGCRIFARYRLIIVRTITICAVRALSLRAADDNYFYFIFFFFP
jgi:hypothetical protein